MAKRNSMNIIFAVTKNVIETYRKLVKLVDGSSVAELDKNSANIVSLIKDQYNVNFNFLFATRFFIFFFVEL
jgi:division protein CdvB (Snf7/Vps24/ESCRT-III family)